MEKSGSAWRILGLGGGGAAALGGVELLLDGYGMFEEAVDALEVHTTVSHVLDGAAGVFHGVNGSLALLLPALHVRLVLGQLREGSADVLLQPEQSHRGLVGQHV